MKFKYSFIFIAVLIILFSIGCVSASENITGDDNCPEYLAYEDISDSLEVDDTSDLGEWELISDEDVDLSVDIDYNAYMVNEESAVVNWDIYAFTSGGNAHNVKVNLNYSDNLIFKSYYVNIGTYDSTNYVWDIGDLDASKNAYLSLTTLLNIEKKDYSNFYISMTANVTTDSHDVNLSNNFIKQNISYKDIVYTQTSNDRTNPQHSSHPNSIPKSDSVKTSKNNENSGNSKSASEGNSNGHSGYDDNSNVKDVSKEIPLDSFSESNNSTNQDNSSNESSVINYYEGIPFFICLLILLIIFVIVGYKIKS